VPGPARRDQPPSPRRAGEADGVRETILNGTESLLGRKRFVKITVADILKEAHVSRASFYFYFESKHAVLAELARRAVTGGHDAASQWLDRSDADDPIASLQRGTLDGAAAWREHGPVLRAVVEHWREDEGLSSLWVELMKSYTKAAVARIERDRESGLARYTDSDTEVVCSILTWMTERCFYLAAIGVPPFDNEEAVGRALVGIWTSTLYGSPSPQVPPCDRGRGHDRG
jgi:TetR/AcrR family transcriptional regulator, ethionamide resistance regulator